MQRSARSIRGSVFPVSRAAAVLARTPQSEEGGGPYYYCWSLFSRTLGAGSYDGPPPPSLESLRSSGVLERGDLRSWARGCFDWCPRLQTCHRQRRPVRVRRKCYTRCVRSGGEAVSCACKCLLRGCAGVSLASALAVPSRLVSVPGFLLLRGYTVIYYSSVTTTVSC